MSAKRLLGSRRAEVESPVVLLEDGDSRSFREWRFQADELEALKLKLDARAADLAREEKILNAMRAQIESERGELVKMRTALEDLRAELEQDYITIAAQELVNLQRLASICSEVGAESECEGF